MQKLALSDLQRATLDEVKELPKLPITLVLDDVRSMHNVGSAFRTADCLAVERLFLCGITGRPPHRDIEKTALGATQSVEWVYFEKIEDAIAQLKAEKSKIWAVEQTSNSINLLDFMPENAVKHAFIYGNEVHGVSDAVLPFVDGSIEIPQFGTKHSFNVSVALGIVTWDFYQKTRRFK
jgi:23S rRNA (guanosine2251-2'-O)-methyltransferase